MKILCEKKEFFRAMQLVQAAISTKGTLPVLMNVLLEAEEEKVRLTATDLEVTMLCVFNASVQKKGAITMPGKKLFEILRELPEGEVNLEVNSNNIIKLNSGNAEYKMAGIAGEEFPVIPEFSDAKAQNVKKEIFAGMIKKTRFAVSTDETRQILCGILMMVEKGKLKMVATDGRRLSYIAKSVPENDKTAQSIKVVIPAKAVNELTRMLEFLPTEAMVKIDVKETQICFNANDITLISRIIDGHFPNYEQVIPKESKIKINLKTQALLQATKRVALMAGDKTGHVKYSLEKNQLTISAKTQEIGEAQDRLDIEYSGEPMEIGYNPAFIIDVLNNADSEDIVFELTNALNPGVIRLPKDDYLAVIMPMRV